jgi:hypothetical protein
MVLTNMTNISELIWMNIWVEIIRGKEKYGEEKEIFVFCPTEGEWYKSLHEFE